MTTASFDDPDLLVAMKAYVAACAALEAAASDAEVLELSDAKSMAAMGLRKRLVDLGWTAPVRARTRTGVVADQPSTPR